MKDKIKNVKNRVVAHVSDHRVSYAVIVSIVAMHKLDQHRVDEWNTFLAEKNLSAEFYNPEEFLESLNPA